MVGKDQDVQIFILGNWIRMVPLTGDEKTGMRIELREVQSSIWGMFRVFVSQRPSNADV